jgi:hypothetical protein
MPRSRYVFAVETVAALRRLGPIVLRYLLLAYGGRLSNLVRELREFADIETYVRAKFGADHHLVSLVRYGLRVHGKRAVEPQPFDPDAVYRLDPGVRILEEMHDCALLLERIANAAELLDDAAIPRDCAYVIGPSAAYRIDPDAVAILELFEEPRSCRMPIDPQFFADLAGAGILIADAEALVARSR